MMMKKKVNMYLLILWIGLTAQVANAQNFAKTASGGSSVGSEVTDEQSQTPTITPEQNNQTQPLQAMTTEETSTYTLGAEDVIEISTQRHPEVSGHFIINSEGKIQYNFLGDVVVEGLTKDQVKEKLTKLLSTYIVSPEVMVTITGYNSKVVLLWGRLVTQGKSS